jgi:hypothetical protein
VFDNLGYHANRSSAGLVGNFGQKLELGGNLVGIGTTDGAIGARAYGPQLVVLLVLAVAGVALLRARSGRIPLLLPLAVLMGLASLLPTPAHTQYFAGVVPFLAVAAVAAVVGVLNGVASPARGALVCAGAAAATVYVAAAAIDVYRYTHVAGSEEARIGFVRRISDVVDEHTRPGDRVLSSWPGYVFETHARPVDGVGLANFVLDATAAVGDDAHADGLLTNVDVERMIRARAVPMIVLRPWLLAQNPPDWAAIARRAGYRELAPIGSALLFVR